MIFSELLKKPKVIAVVGASNDESKYGYRVYKFLKDKGYEVYPVNPNRDTIQGDRAYPALKDLPKQPDIVNVVTPPEVSKEIYRQAAELKLPLVWFQPGAEFSSETDETKRPALVVNHCIMVETSKITPA